MATRAGAHGENQDRAAAGPGWAVVSDGVGGHAGGARAAALTVEAAGSVLAGRPATPASVREAFAAAQLAVTAGQADDDRVARMAATLVVAALAAGPGGDGDAARWVIGHVGDSPAWVVADGVAVQVTDDHTVAGDLLQQGVLLPEEAAEHPSRRFVTRVVGGDGGDEPDVVEVELGPGQGLVLASDGVADVQGRFDLGSLVEAAPSSQLAAVAVADAAVVAGSRDDVTVIVVRRLASCAT